MELDLLLRAVMGPAAMAVAVLVVLRLAFGARRWAASAPAWVAVLMVSAPIAAFAHQEGGLRWPPALAYDWLPVAMAAAAGIAFGLRLPPAGSWRWRLGASVGAAFVSLSVIAPPGHSSAEWRLLAAAIVSASAFGAASGWGGLPAAPGHAPASRLAAAMPFLSMWAVAAAGSVVVILSGFAKLAVVMGALSACSAALAVGAFAVRGTRAGGATSVAFAVILGAAAWFGLGYDEAGIPSAAWVVLAMSPAASASALAVPAARPRTSMIVSAAAPAAVAAAAVAIAIASVGLPGSSSEDANPYARVTTP